MHATLAPATTADIPPPTQQVALLAMDTDTTIGFGFQTFVKVRPPGTLASIPLEKRATPG